jgi:excisionase family DNA binding protein
MTPKQAAVLLGCTARNVQNLISKGKISATREDGKWFIEKSEFFRVFPEAFKRSEEGNDTNKAIKSARIEVENDYLKEMAVQKDREIEFLRNQLESFTKEKSQMLEAITHHTRLLEHIEGPKKSHTGGRKGWFYIFRKHKD